MDRLSDTLVEALATALSKPGEHRLYRSGKLEGLFPGRTGVGGDAAAQALRDGLLEHVRTETRGKVQIDWVRITPRGVEFLHQQRSPVQALHEVRDLLRVNQEALPSWLMRIQDVLDLMQRRVDDEVQQWRARLAALEQTVGDTLRRLEAAGPLVPGEVARTHPWAIDALNYLDRRRTNGAPDACPLPELFAAIVPHHPTLSLGAYHDGLRQLNLRRALSLMPASDPLSMTRPEFALWEGGAVYYLASR